MGLVYVYNVTSQTVTINLNGWQAAELPPNPNNGLALPSVALPISAGGNPEAPEFGSQTQVTIESGGGANYYNLQADPNQSPIFLFILLRHLVLASDADEQMVSQVSEPGAM
jgi:hypothetical protein